MHILAAARASLESYKLETGHQRSLTASTKIENNLFQEEIMIGKTEYLYLKN